MVRSTLNSPLLSVAPGLSPADLARLEDLADCLAQAGQDVMTGSQLALPMLDQLQHDLANDRAAAAVWADVKRLERER